MKQLHERKLKFLTVYTINQCSWYLSCSKPFQMQSLCSVKQRYKNCLINLVVPFHIASSVLFLFFQKHHHVIKNFSQPWRKLNSPRKTMCSFQSVLRVVSTNQCSAILPRATAGVFWLIRDVPSLVHQRGKGIHVQCSKVEGRRCLSVHVLACRFLLLVELYSFLPL